MGPRVQRKGPPGKAGKAGNDGAKGKSSGGRRPNNRATKVILDFDADAQKEFLLGYRKRKLLRRTKAMDKLEQKAREEKLSIRADRRKEKQPLLDHADEAIAKIESMKKGEYLYDMEDEMVHENEEEDLEIVTSVADVDLSELQSLKRERQAKSAFSFPTVASGGGQDSTASKDDKEKRGKPKKTAVQTLAALKKDKTRGAQGSRGKRLAPRAGKKGQGGSSNSGGKRGGKGGKGGKR